MVSRSLPRLVSILFIAGIASPAESLERLRTPVFELAACSGSPSESTSDFINSVITGGKACDDKVDEVTDPGQPDLPASGMDNAQAIDMTIYESRSFEEDVIIGEWAGVGELCRSHMVDFTAAPDGYLGKSENTNQFDGYKTNIVLEVSRSRLVKGKSRDGDDRFYDYFTRNFPTKVSRRNQDGKTIGFMAQMPVILEMYWSGKYNDLVFFVRGTASDCRYRRTSQMTSDTVD